MGSILEVVAVSEGQDMARDEHCCSRCANMAHQAECNSLTLPRSKDRLVKLVPETQREAKLDLIHFAQTSALPQQRSA